MSSKDSSTTALADTTLPAEVKDPHSEAGPKADAAAKFAVLQAPNVVPAAFEDVWEPKMDKWGRQMLTAVEDVNEMLAVGLGLEAQSLKYLAR